MTNEEIVNENNGEIINEVNEEIIEEKDKEMPTKEKTSWIKTKPAELQKIIIELAKEGNSPSKIGIILRDKYGIPKTKLLGKKITQILKESKISYLTEKDIVEDKIKKLKIHLEKNKKDNSASRSLTKQLWQQYHLNKLQS